MRSRLSEDFGAGRKARPAGTCHPSGRLPLNTGGTSLVDLLAHERGLARDQYSVVLGANGKNHVVAVFAAPHDTEKAMAIRRDADDQNITLYLHGVFKENPDLRPSGKIICRLYRTKDSKGVPCVAISLRGGFTKAKGRRPSQNGDKS